MVAVCTLNGDEYDPVRYLAATSPSGERLSTMQFDWHGDDNPDAPIKYRVFAQQLPIVVGSEGTYTLALCEDPDAADVSAAVFSLQIFRNPMAPLAEDARYGSLPDLGAAAEAL